MNIFSNREIYIHQKIDEYLLLYNSNMEEYIGFNIDGYNLLGYYDGKVNFDMIKNGLDYHYIDLYFDQRNYIFINIYAEENEYYQLNMYPENVDLNINLNSYYIYYGILNIDTDVAITLKKNNMIHYYDGLAIFNEETLKILSNKEEIITEFFRKEEKILIIESIDLYDDPQVIYITKKYINESIQIVGSNKNLKIVLPYLKRLYFLQRLWI